MAFAWRPRRRLHAGGSATARSAARGLAALAALRRGCRLSPPYPCGLAKPITHLAISPSPPTPPHTHRSGFYAWFRIFDNKGGRRRSGEYAEQYSHDGDSAGIHSSGAGFDRVDAIEKWVPPKF